jgi:hypothetical protein
MCHPFLNPFWVSPLLPNPTALLSLSIKRLLALPSLPDHQDQQPPPLEAAQVSSIFSTLGTAIDLGSCTTPLHPPCRDPTALGCTIVVPSGAFLDSTVVIIFPTFDDLVVSNPDVPFPLHGFLMSSLRLYASGSSSAIVSHRCCAKDGSALSYCGTIKSRCCCIVDCAALSCSCPNGPCRRCAEDGTALSIMFCALC